MWYYALLFMFGLVFDTLWVICVHAVERNRRHIATMSSVALTALGGFGGAKIAANEWLLIPELFGVAIGMHLGLHVAHRLDTRSDRGDAGNQ